MLSEGTPDWNQVDSQKTDKETAYQLLYKWIELVKDSRTSVLADPSVHPLYKKI